MVPVSPKVYPIEAIYSACYVLLDRAYVFLDGDPEREIIVSMRLKSGNTSDDELLKLGYDFANQLINYSDYQKRADSSRKTREMLLQKALFTNDPNAFTSQNPGDDFDRDEFERLLKELEEDDENIKDPEGIMDAWEESYSIGEDGKGQKGKVAESRQAAKK